jgi:hypothetical protein
MEWPWIFFISAFGCTEGGSVRNQTIEVSPGITGKEMSARLLGNICFNDLEIAVGQPVKVPTMQPKIVPSSARFRIQYDLKLLEAGRVNSPVKHAGMVAEDPKLHAGRSNEQESGNHLPDNAKLVHDENQSPPLVMEFASLELLFHATPPMRQKVYGVRRLKALRQWNAGQHLAMEL